MNRQSQEKTKAYDDDREKINVRYARQDAGKPIITKEGAYDIPPESMEAYDKEQQELREKYKAVFDEFEKFDKEEIDVEVYAVNYSRIENLELPSGSFDIITPLVNLEA
jgi:hypothetical protein